MYKKILDANKAASQPQSNPPAGANGQSAAARA